MYICRKGKALRLKHCEAAGIVVHRDLFGGENMADIGACKVLGMARPKYLITGPLPWPPRPPPDKDKGKGKPPPPLEPGKGKKGKAAVSMTVSHSDPSRSSGDGPNKKNLKVDSNTVATTSSMDENSVSISNLSKAGHS